MNFDFDIGQPARTGLRCACGTLDPRVESDKDGRITGYECGRCGELLDVRYVPTQLALDL